jgi:hypothetical protein
VALSYVAQYTLTATTQAELTKAISDLAANPAVTNIKHVSGKLHVTFTLTSPAPSAVA